MIEQQIIENTENATKLVLILVFNVYCDDMFSMFCSEDFLVI